MIIFKRPADLRSYLLAKETPRQATGFIPTMGALHSGHISLITKARNENQLVICSIFVNPTQFNDPKDFEKYPSTIENDICLLEQSACDILFLPSVMDIYPNGIDIIRQYDLGPLERILEGQFRPGHFQGVCQVVNRLLEIVMPGKLYLGQKDFQQCMVLKKLISLLGIDTEVIVCPTLREPDGLAMSSRNLRLNQTERKTATAIYHALLTIKDNIKLGDTRLLTQSARQNLSEAGFKVDYVEIAKSETLEILQSWDGTTPLVTLAAAYLNDIRLIDNLLIQAS
ncbi:MAG: Pantothenate synthetase [Ferruginibacter sp.]|nr:Pantothenate synthetase [Ferruginibacter sp.]